MRTMKVTLHENHIEVVGFPDYPCTRKPKLEFSYEVGVSLTLLKITEKLLGVDDEEYDYMRIMGAK